MRKIKSLLWVSVLLLSGLLSACGSSGGSTANSGDGLVSAVSGGVAVDPYIVNARFEEVAADGSQIIQNSSTASDSRGRFSFANPLQDGSIIRLKSSNRGMHGNAPFAGMLKRRVQADDDGNLVVSPLTTLLANGMSEGEVIAMLESAGLNGLVAADLTADPMQGLSGATDDLNDDQLRGLRANMAVNTLLLAREDFDFNGAAQSEVNLADCVALSNETLSAANFQTLAATLSPELGGAFTFDDLAVAAVETQRTLVAQIQQDLAAGSGVISGTRFAQLRSAAMTELASIARDVSAARIAASSTSPDAANLFAADCAGCHSLGNGGGMDLSGDGVLLDARFGSGASHNGRNLNANDILALAAHLDASVTTEPPTNPVTGSEIYAAECQGCHGSLATTDISDRSDNGISAAIAANAGGMGYLSLDAAQIALIVDALPLATIPPTPNPERSASQVYDQECALCHALGNYDSAGSIDLATKGGLIVTKVEGGHKSRVLSSTELAALADFANTFGSVPPPVVPRSAETVYNDSCTTCHMLSGYDESGAIDLAGRGNSAVTKVAGDHGGSVSTLELSALAAWIDGFSAPPPQAVARDGATIYDQSCAACHMLYAYDSVGNIDLASTGDTALSKLVNGHGGTLSSEEQQNIAAWLDTWAPAPPPLVDRNGETVYSENCAGCHKLYGYDSVGNVDLASQGDLSISKLGTGHGGSLSAGEIVNLTNWLDTWSSAPPPVVARGGQEIYDVDCAACHKVNGYDAVGSAPDIAANGSGTVSKLNGGHNGINLLVEELGNLSAWLDTYQAGDPYAGSCTACHGQPPLSGAHEVHSSLARVGTDCAVCHDSASHNGTIDLAIQASWNAQSGSASSNGNTCSNISCHGGQSTPDWNSGSLNSSTQCKSCHVSGSSQYNGYSSGEHKKHAVDKRYDCLICHDAGKLANGHFDDLGTISFEQSPATTIKSSLSYSGGSCATANCHGSERW